jgi:hypothetical protein
LLVLEEGWILCVSDKTFGTGVLNLIQINHQPDAKSFQFLILTFVYSSTCFGRFPAHHQELNDCSGSLWFYLRIVVTLVLCSWLGRPAVRPESVVFQFAIKKLKDEDIYNYNFARGFLYGCETWSLTLRE